MNDALELDSAQKSLFIGSLNERKKWYSTGRKSWSFAHHFTLYLSIFLGAAATIIPQIQGVFTDATQKNATSVVAGLGTLLLSIGTGGSFSRKWRANRFSNGKVEQLILELMARQPNTSDIARLSQIDEEHNKALFGE